MEPRTGRGPAASVLLYWLPLGAGGRSVRFNGRIFEALVARHEHRAVRDLYHSALEVHLGDDRFVVEMTPAWGAPVAERGVVREGPVGARWLGRFRAFRYEIRCWHLGVIPDLDEAVGGPRPVSHDHAQARRLLELVPAVPTVTWGRDELRTGDMWNSNSLTAWLLARSGHDTDDLGPPANGRAPGWHAGLIAAAREPHLRATTGPGRQPEDTDHDQVVLLIGPAEQGTTALPARDRSSGWHDATGPMPLPPHCWTAHARGTSENADVQETAMNDQTDDTTRRIIVGPQS